MVARRGASYSIRCPDALFGYTGVEPVPALSGFAALGMGGDGHG